MWINVEYVVYRSAYHFYFKRLLPDHRLVIQFLIQFVQTMDNRNPIRVSVLKASRSYHRVHMYRQLNRLVNNRHVKIHKNLLCHGQHLQLIMIIEVVCR
jgi:hypothetical protein